MAKTPNAQDSTRRNVRAANKRIARLERELRKTKKVIGLMAEWIADTRAGDKPLSHANAAQLIQKLK